MNTAPHPLLAIHAAASRAVTATAVFVLAVTMAAPAAAQSGGYGYDPQPAGADPFAGEPSVDAAIDAATRRFHVRVEDMNRYRTRASISGLMPQLDVSMRTTSSTLDLDNFDNLQFPGDEPASVNDGSAEAIEMQISAGWDLSRVVFNPLVLDVNSMVTLYDQVAEEVINLYYLRQRLVLSMINDPPSDEGSRRTMELRIAQATATLNALTGGLFADRTF